MILDSIFVVNATFLLVLNDVIAINCMRSSFFLFFFTKDEKN